MIEIKGADADTLMNFLNVYVEACQCLESNTFEIQIMFLVIYHLILSEGELAVNNANEGLESGKFCSQKDGESFRLNKHFEGSCELLRKQFDNIDII